MQSKDTLYNKYRPQSFADVVDQNHIKVTLQNEIATDKLAHAYIFTGPRGVGKTTIARILAKTLNCENKEDKGAEPCNQCSVCLDINNNKSLDLIEIDAASQTKVEQTRDNIIAASRVTASAGRIKIFIIDEVHMLSSASFNALLKTLEEPPAKVVFILATTEIHKVPETIVSRCQRFDFHRIGINDLVKWMEEICLAEKRQVKKDVLTAIAKQAEGGARDALSLLGQVLSLGDGEITFDQASLILPRSDFIIITEVVEYLINQQADQAVTLLNKSLTEGVDLNQLLKDLIEYLRQLLLLKIMGNKEKIMIDMDQDSLKAIREQSEKISTEQLIFILDTLIAKWQQIKLSILPQLPIELAFIMICQGSAEVVNVVAEKAKPEAKIATASIVKEPEQKEVKKKLSDIKASDGKESIAVKEQTSVELDATSQVKDQSSAKSSEVGDKKAFNSDKVIKLDDLKDKWDSILKDLKEQNHSLAGFMKVARAIKLENNEFLLGFQYKFHLEVLEDLNKKKIIEEVIGDNLRAKIIVKGIIDPDYEKREMWEVNVAEDQPIQSEGDKPLQIAEIGQLDEDVDVVSEF
ncbi:MAG: DNA polymerase III subunit gamma/tau [Candidatus Komeilibacteria bacterium]